MRVGSFGWASFFCVVVGDGIMRVKGRFDGSDWVVCLVVFESENVMRVFIYRGVSFF